MGWIAGLGMSWTGEVHLLFSPASKFVITKSFLCSAFADVQNPESFKFAFLYKQRPGVAKGWTYREHLASESWARDWHGFCVSFPFRLISVLFAD